MSCRTRCVALAVNAAIGWSGKFSRSELSWRYSGRNSWPHSEMQCASSMAKNARGIALQPADRVLPRQPLGREIEQPVRALRRCTHHLALLVRALRAVHQRRRNSHIGELRHLILHQRDQRRNHHHRLPERQRGSW